MNTDIKIASYKQTDDIYIDGQYLYMVLKGNIGTGKWTKVLIDNKKIFTNCCEQVKNVIQQKLKDSNFVILQQKYKNPNISKFELFVKNNKICIGCPIKELGFDSNDYSEALQEQAHEQEMFDTRIFRSSNNNVKIAKQLLKIARQLI